jgi:hypothetical protein
VTAPRRSTTDRVPAAGLLRAPLERLEVARYLGARRAAHRERNEEPVDAVASVFADAVTLNVSNRQSTSMIAVAHGPYVAALMNAYARRSL